MKFWEIIYFDNMSNEVHVRLCARTKFGVVRQFIRLYGGCTIKEVKEL